MTKASIGTLILRYLVLGFLINSAHALGTEIDEDESFVAGMYIAILNRSPAPGGFVFWTNIVKDGNSYEYVANEMWESAGAQEVYPRTLSTREMVATVYRNVLNREPKEGGLNFWSGIWDDKGAAHTMIAMINHLLNWQPEDPQSPTEEEQLGLMDQSLFQDKVVIGNYLAVEKGNNDLELARAAFAFLEEGNSLEDSVAFIDYRVKLQEPVVGYFIDAPVEGLTYQTDTRSGVTDSQGAFEFIPGETAAFRLGNVMLGEAGAAALMSPLTFYPDAVDHFDPRVSAQLSFLQSLDEDCDGSNGITLNQSVINTADQLVFDFGNSSDLSQWQDVLTPLLDEVTCREDWINPTEAALHFQIMSESAYQQVLSENLLIHTLSGESDPSVFVDRAGNFIQLLPSNNEIEEDERILLTDADLNQITVSIGENGLPQAVFFSNGTVILFDNFTYETVDLVISHEGDPQQGIEPFEIAKRIPLPSNTANLIEYLNRLDQANVSGESLLAGSAEASESSLFQALISFIFHQAYAQEEENILHLSADFLDGMALAVAKAAAVVNLLATIINTGEFVDISKALLNNEIYITTFLKNYNEIYTTTWLTEMSKAQAKTRNETLVTSYLSGTINIAACRVGAMAGASVGVLGNCLSAISDALNYTAVVLQNFAEASRIWGNTLNDKARIAAMRAKLEAMEFSEYPPIVKILNPIDGSKFSKGETVILLGSSKDPDADEVISDDEVQWIIDDVPLPGSNAHRFELNTEGLDGHHTIAFKAVDSTGKEGISDPITIFFKGGNPTAKIISPTRDQYTCGDLPLTLEGEGADPEDGDISGDTFTWETQVVTDSGTETETHYGNNQPVSFSNCPAEGEEPLKVVVKLIVTDSVGQEDTAYKFIEVGVSEDQLDPFVGSYSISGTVVGFCPGGTESRNWQSQTTLSKVSDFQYRIGFGNILTFNESTDRIEFSRTGGGSIRCSGDYDGPPIFCDLKSSLLAIDKQGNFSYDALWSSPGNVCGIIYKASGSKLP